MYRTSLVAVMDRLVADRVIGRWLLGNSLVLDSWLMMWLLLHWLDEDGLLLNGLLIHWLLVGWLDVHRLLIDWLYMHVLMMDRLSMMDWLLMMNCLLMMLFDDMAIMVPIKLKWKERHTSSIDCGWSTTRSKTGSECGASECGTS